MNIRTFSIAFSAEKPHLSVAALGADLNEARFVDSAVRERLPRHVEVEGMQRLRAAQHVHIRLLQVCQRVLVYDVVLPVMGDTRTSVACCGVW